MFLLPAHAHAAAADAGKYLEAIANQTLGVISDKTLSKDKKQAKLEKLFGDNVDFPWVGRFVMGRFWRQASDAQKSHYLQEYQKFLLLHYTTRFTEYTSGGFKVLGTKEDGDHEYVVSMQIQTSDSGSEPVMVDYRVREDGGKFKIFDVIVEGVSMITTQRSEFSSILNNKGIDYLIGQLAAKAKTGDIDMSDAGAGR